MITASIVSHGHGAMVWRLVDQLVGCSEVAQVIVTLNIPETIPDHLNNKVLLLRNDEPKGFGANHNSAFCLALCEYYCVINPDIELTSNPFPLLLDAMVDPVVGLVAPLVLRPDGLAEDSMRRFLTPSSMAKRILGLDSGAYLLPGNSSELLPDWVAGMFMLFRSEAYKKVGGFDERYFMYCEDADMCTRLWRLRYKVVGCLSTSVIHNAQRASRRNFKHSVWHIQSMMRYFVRHACSMPKKII